MQNNFQGLTFAYLPHSYLQAAGSVLSATRGQKAGVLFHVSDLLVRDCSASSFRPKKWAAESLGGRDSDYDGWMIEDAPTFPSMFLYEQEKLLRPFLRERGGIDVRESRH